MFIHLLLSFPPRPQSLSLSFPHVSLTPFVTSIYKELQILWLTRENKRPFYLAHSSSDPNCMLFRSIGLTVLYPSVFECTAFSNPKQNSLTQHVFVDNWFLEKNSQQNRNISDLSCPHFQFVVIWSFFLSSATLISGDRGGTVVKVLCYKSEGRWFDSRWCHWNFSLT